MNRWRRRDVGDCGVIVRRASHPPSRARCRRRARTPRARSPVTIETPERVTPGDADGDGGDGGDGGDAGDDGDGGDADDERRGRA